MKYLEFNKEGYYKIENSDNLRPFFMSIVSDANHWMFISSNGGLTAGRKNSDYALFPYYTDDKITESFETTGSKTIFLATTKNKQAIWEPFSDRYTGVYKFTRNLYKNEYGNKVIFEEINHDLGLTYQCHWNSSNTYGFVKKSVLINTSKETVNVKMLDGLQNIIPYGVKPDLQQSSSNLVDAYKKSELIKASGLGVFALSAIIVDKAEPSEALKANIVWSHGIKNSTILLSSLQLNAFRKTGKVTQEEDVRAEKGSYFVVSDVEIKSAEEKEWMFLADVNKSAADVINISNTILQDKDIKTKVLADVALGSKNLLALTNAADGKQQSADKRKNTRHYANVLFNIMRGGIFDDNYTIEKDDFTAYILKANKNVHQAQKGFLAKLPVTFSQVDLKEIAWQSKDKNFSRLCFEYLPLKFSRRHGDPSRPWNKFSINTTSEVDGSKILDYQGNWRDIFQNWEALAHSYPEFIENMIHKFLNATTFDGYNPYRVTKDGFDWEIIEPEDPWSYIGYWGDHQIIYLLKFLEFIEKYYPSQLQKYFKENCFVYANVPYRIKGYNALLVNPKDTIDFNQELDQEIRKKRNILGADGALLTTADNQIYQVNLIEKLLATLLAKCSNFIPEGGIWLTTQRPEWNDANNALVGNGVSMVTLYYMRRFVSFFNTLISSTEQNSFDVSEELNLFFNEVVTTLQKNENILLGKVSNSERKQILDGLGNTAGTYRSGIYDSGFSGKKLRVRASDLSDFSALLLKYIDHSIAANKRADSLYHAYNLMTVENNTEVSISYLSEMLEGQVAVLSSGYLSSKEVLSVLDGLKNSKLFREDQYSYVLYPNKQLPLFIERNNISASAVKNSKLLQRLLKEGNSQIIEVDNQGGYHFNGNFKNAASLEEALGNLSESYCGLVNEETPELLQVFEGVFNHKSFTGRSGTFYGYEGLGSIYWHMVSKLLLAVQECCIKAIEDQEGEELVGRLLEHYYEINAGIGVHKSPELYGAFPTDPYSHTPGGKGAQQPGMTGQVKEDVLSRFGELGIVIKNGQIRFVPDLLLKEEFLEIQEQYHFTNVQGKENTLALEKGQLCFTYCQIPVIYELGDKEAIKVKYANGSSDMIDGKTLSVEKSQIFFKRTGEIEYLHIIIIKS